MPLGTPDNTGENVPDLYLSSSPDEAIDRIHAYFIEKFGDSEGARIVWRTIVNAVQYLAEEETEGQHVFEQMRVIRDELMPFLACDTLDEAEKKCHALLSLEEEISLGLEYAADPEAQMESTKEIIRNILYEENPDDVEFFIEYLAATFSAPRGSYSTATAFDSAKAECVEMRSYVKKQGSVGVYRLFVTTCINVKLFGKENTLTSIESTFPWDGAITNLENVPRERIVERLNKSNNLNN